MVLEHDAALQAGGRDAFTVEQDVAFVFGFQPDDQAQQGGFAAAAGADDADEFTRAYVEVDVLQHRQGAAFDSISFVQAANLQGAGLHVLMKGSVGDCIHIEAFQRRLRQRSRWRLSRVNNRVIR